MSNDTGRDQAAPSGDGVKPVTGGSTDPVWPVWGGTPKTPVEPVVEPEVEPADEVEPVIEPSTEDAPDVEDEADAVATDEGDAVTTDEAADDTVETDPVAAEDAPDADADAPSAEAPAEAEPDVADEADVVDDQADVVDDQAHLVDDEADVVDEADVAADEDVAVDGAGTADEDVAVDEAGTTDEDVAVDEAGPAVVEAAVVAAEPADEDPAEPADEDAAEPADDDAAVDEAEPASDAAAADEPDVADGADGAADVAGAADAPETAQKDVVPDEADGPADDAVAVEAPAVPSDASADAVDEAAAESPATDAASEPEPNETRPAALAVEGTTAPPAEDATEVLPPVVAAASVAAVAADRPTGPAAETPTAPVTPPVAETARQAPVAAPVVAPPPAPVADPAPTAVLPPVVSPEPAPVIPAAAAAAATAAATPSPAAPGGFAPVTASAAAATGTLQSGRVPSSERAPSPFDVFEPEVRRRRWPRRLLIILGIVLVLGAAYVAASYAVADKVPRGASVAGVDIGGMTSAAAVTELETELADATTQPIPVTANDEQATLDPTTSGLTFDAQATVDQLTGVNLADPSQLWGHIIGVGEQPPVTAVDVKKLSASVDGLGTALALVPVDGTIVYVDATAQSTDAVDGWKLDAAESAKVIASDWLVAPRPLVLPTTTVPPTITQEKTDAALVEATKVTSAPVSVVVSGKTALLDASTLATNSAYMPIDGNLSLQMNGDGLTAAVLAQLPDLLTASADAHFEFQNGAPVIVPGTPGTTLDPAAVATAVSAAAVSSDRTAEVELVTADPAQSTAALEALGVKEIVSEFSTPLTSEPRRTVNITNGAAKISGTLIKPDETFSLTAALGPIDAAHGFVEAGAIINGEHTDAWGGGLSQISTTTYNAAFLAGYEDVEHRPHSEWFARYPEGREATIFTGTLDMRWKNNTPYGALVQAWVANNRVYVRVWSTKYYSVESITSPRSGVVQPTTVYSQSPTCEAQSAGNPGFAVTVTRKTSLNGVLVNTESNKWRYKPQNKIVCGPAPTP